MVLESPLRGRAAPILLLLGLCAFLFFHGLGTGALYRTESLRAIIAAEALRDGHWLVPTLYGEPMLTKPPGMYTAIALASWPGGVVSTASARLPSALAATLTVFLFYRTFRRTLGRGAGLVAALLLPQSIMWLERAPSAEIDMVQLAWVAAALLAFLRVLEEVEDQAPGRSRWHEWLRWQIALLCVVGGLLTKWTAPAFFYLAVVPVLAWRGRLRLLVGWPHLLALAVAALPCLAWVGAVVSAVGWQPLYETVRREALQHLSPAHHPRPYPWREVLTFPALFLLTNLPWSALALYTLRPQFLRLWDERGRRLVMLLHGWTWANLLFWSFVPGHRPRHGLPLQPGLAGLAALVWIAWLTGRLRWPLPRLRPGPVFAGLLLIWIGAKLAFTHAVVPSREQGREPRATGAQLRALVPPDETLYLFGLKDEGILFYYGRPARRLPAPGRLPAAGGYCLLCAREWRSWSVARPQVVSWMRDEQGDAIVLVRVADDERARGPDRRGDPGDGGG